MAAASRMALSLRWRQRCLRFGVAVLLIQFLFWFYLALSRSSSPSAPLGRRGGENAATESQRSEAARSHERANFDAAVGAAGKETATDTVLTDTDALPLRTQRLTEAASAQSTSVPGVDDVFARLQEYLKLLNREHFYTDLAAVQKLQKRTRAAEMHAQPLDDLKDLQSLPKRIEFLNRLAAQAEERAEVRISIFTTSAVDRHGLRTEILPWMQYHTHLGVTHFYVLYDGHDAESVKMLESIQHVTVVHIHPPFAKFDEVHLFRVWSERHKQWGGKPGNYELMVKQGYGLTVSLRLAEQQGGGWMLHLDPDELFYPDNAAFSMVDEFVKQPEHVSSLRFMNFEGQPEFGDVVNRYEQVTLFRTHKYFITPEANFLRSRCKLGDNRTFLVLYANGKSAVRVDAPGVRQLGPHFFTGDSSDRWKTPQNPKGHWRDAISNSSFILHYGYSYLLDVTRKAERSCPGDNFKRAAELQNQKELGKCFLIDFDRDAYVAAMTGQEEDFFYSRQVLSEGVRLRCRAGGVMGWCVVHDVDYFKFLLTKAGLFKRAREPQQILRMHEYRIQMELEKDEDIEELRETEIHPLETGWP